jgi:transposase
VAQLKSQANELKGKTVAVDATTLQANATLGSILRRDTGESYPEFLTSNGHSCDNRARCRVLCRTDRDGAPNRETRSWVPSRSVPSA